MENQLTLTKDSPLRVFAKYFQHNCNESKNFINDVLRLNGSTTLEMGYRFCNNASWILWLALELDFEAEFFLDVIERMQEKPTYSKTMLRGERMVYYYTLTNTIHFDDNEFEDIAYEHACDLRDDAIKCVYAVFTLDALISRANRLIARGELPRKLATKDIPF